jgi:hypothetical protein
MQETARITVSRMPYGADPYVSPVQAVKRVRFRMRLRRARTDFLPLYVGAGVAGGICGFVLSIT